MKSFLFLILTPMLMLLFFNNESMDKDTKKVYDFLEKLSSEIEKRYDANVIGNTVSMPNEKVEVLGLTIQLNEPQKKEVLRRIIIEISDLFLYEINNNKEISKFLIRHPFTLEETNLRLIIEDDNKSTSDSDISVVILTPKKIIYMIFFDESRPIFREEEETLEEALRILDSENK